MGWFASCFGAKGKDRSPDDVFSSVICSKSRERPVSRNQLSYLIALQEEPSSPSKYEEQNALQTTLDYNSEEDGERGLKTEAKSKSFHKVFQTSSGIQNSSKNFEALLHDGDDASSEFHSRHLGPPGTSCQKLNLEEDSYQFSVSKDEIFEKRKVSLVQESSGSLPHDSKIRFTSEGQKDLLTSYSWSTNGHVHKCPDKENRNRTECNDLSVSPAAPELPAVCMQCEKSVRFHSDSAVHSDVIRPLCNFSSPTESGHCNFLGSSREDVGTIHDVELKHSPCMIPMKTADEIRASGTTCETVSENFASGKNARIRSQCVYPVFSHTEISSEWNAKEFESQEPAHPEETFDEGRKARSGSPKTLMKSYKDDADFEQNCTSLVLANESLSDWLKPVTNNENQRTISSENSCSHRSCDDDRPILGVVASHWNIDEQSHIPAKSWDGNGIPNSTNKYKEDQKVSWHAIPFEERLEMALSEEKHFPQRSEESDTAASSFQTSHLHESSGRL